MRQISCTTKDDLVTLFFGNKAFPVNLKSPLEDICSSHLEQSISSKESSEVNPESVLAEKDEAIANWIDKVLEGLLYFPPELCEEGINGTYFLRNKEGKRIAVFKPIDEEGNTKNNPKRSDENLNSNVNSGILAGEGAQREIAAYLLDHQHFSGVPRTTMVNLSHPSFKSFENTKEIITKTGSLQEFIDNDGAAWDIGPNIFTIKDVHKIGVLDLRIFNNDRHGGNILLVEDMNTGGFKLVPIDQGFSLSSTFDHAWFEWLMWPQAKIPFDEETRKYISHLDIEKDEQILQKLGIRSECILTMKISTTLLKKGAEAGLTLFEIGSIASRMDIEQPSDLETIYEEALKQVPSKNQEELLEVISKLMDKKIECKLSERCLSPRIKEPRRGQIDSKRAV